MQIRNHTELLNALITKYNLNSYLEIGINNPENNFDKIICNHKIGVDPETEAREVRKMGGSEQIFKITSDEYFNAEWPNSLPKIDLGFIDGNHTKEQVKKDFENLLACLSDNGFIVIHDVLPENEEGTRVPREKKVWWGDVYKWAMSICEYAGIEFKTFNIDNGCMVVKKNIVNRGRPARIKRGNTEYSFDFNWDSYNMIGKQLMNVVDEVTV